MEVMNANSVLLVLWLVFGIFIFIGFIGEFKNRGGIKNLIACGTLLDKEETDSLKGLMAIGIMISHVALNAIGIVNGKAGYLKLMLASLGGVGVATFFTLSGYGCYYSAKRRVSNFTSLLSWTIKKIVKCLLAFIICFFSCAIIYLAFGEKIMIADFLHLSMPFQTTWYLKMQLVMYFLMFLSLMVNINDQTRCLIFLFILSIFIAVALRTSGLQTFWWDTSLCFFSGYFTGYLLDKKPEIKNGISVASFLMISFALFVSFIFTQMNCYWILKILANFVFGLSFVIILSFIYRSKISSFIGNMTIEIYLIHVGLISLFFRNDENANVITVTLFMIVSIIIALVVSKLNKAIGKKIKI